MTPLIYGMSASGNCYKIQLALALLNLPYRWEEVDILTGATREPDFLARNPNGRVPTAEVAPGQFLAESNAILLYFGEGTTLVPEQRWPRATLFQWLFFEQYSHEPYIAVARFINRFLPPDHPRRSELPQLIERG
ncbi:MAG: glutathione S-transferase, partial [Pseudomonadota bacterium]